MWVISNLNIRLSLNMRLLGLNILLLFAIPSVRTRSLFKPLAKITLAAPVGPSHGSTELKFH